jgi:DNA processing protein
MKYEYWFAKIQGINVRKKIRLRQCMKTAEAIYSMEEMQLKEMEFLNERERNKILQAKQQEDLEKEYDRLRKKEIRFIPCFAEEYPKNLKQITDYPYALYVKGNLPDEEAKKVALVGARRCTPYGEKYAVDFGKALAECGIQIISGMARGVDGMGHRGALMGRGKTFAVLGCGVDVCYPREHIGLYVDILEQGGGILSELPPKTPPLPQHFPARNRIISGLSDAVLVMEAGRKSGSLITVDMALEQGKEVYALPGPVNSQMSIGCNELIRQGAGILLSPEMILEEWNLSEQKTDGSPEMNKKSGKDSKNKKTLETQEELLYSCLGLYPKSVEEILRETKLEVRKVMEILVSLELRGYIREISKNYYIIT